MTELKYASKHASWEDRCIQATGGNRSQLGAIVLAVLGRTVSIPPAFNKEGAIITSDGFVLANFVNKDWQLFHSAFVCSIDDLTANISGLADHLKLSDEERVALFRKVREWCKTDYRAIQNRTLHFTEKGRHR